VSDCITVRGARVHNLKDVDVDLPRNKLVVLTGVSGSGKSSLALDTLYAEGQRRYVESFSAYARQFLERMDKPDVDRVENIPPAIAIEQRNPVRNRRSTLGTATELNDYLRLLWARVGGVFCPACDGEVAAHPPARVADELLTLPDGTRFLVAFPLAVTAKLDWADQMAGVREMGFVRLRIDGQTVDISDGAPAEISDEVEVVVDRLAIGPDMRQRLVEAVETCYRLGRARCRVHVVGEDECREFSSRSRCVDCGRETSQPTPQGLSFNSPLGACPTCNGYGATTGISRDKCVPDPSLTIREGAVAAWNTDSTTECMEQLTAGAADAGLPLDVPWCDLSTAQRDMVFDGSDSFYGVMDYFNWQEGRKYKMHVRVLLSRFRSYLTCPDCDGSRLTPEARAVRLHGRNVAQACAMTVADARKFFDEMQLTDHEQEIAGLLLRELRARLGCLDDIGLGYLTLDRMTRTLSGGEMQRVNLSTSLGSALVNTLYILDEPSVGLHPRDTERLVAVLEQLRDLGNTVVVVEHDRQIIEAADHVIDVGPLAGARGGRIVYAGAAAGLVRCKDSLTGDYISGRKRMPVPDTRHRPGPDRIVVHGAREHNLKDITVEFPLGLIVCVTGVSGSGKSTLVHDTLYGAVQRGKPGGYADHIGEHDRVTGCDLIDEVILIDQQPIGLTPRSNPATYMKLFDDVRRLFAGTRMAKIRGLDAGSFSFNTAGGRCEACDGAGMIRVDMQFLADVFVTCEQCLGRRFGERVLEVTWRGRSVHDVLEMTVDEALSFFAEQPRIYKRLRYLRDTGLGYIRLGQSATTLSGGEAQRLKLATQMASRRKTRVLFLFDEPTVGLHMHDVRLLLSCFQSLADQGHTVVVIEHNTDVIEYADHVIDLGPEPGDGGGHIVVAGTPEQVAACAESITGKFLRPA
jgi:excinuclease ABC subunit A